MPLLVMTGLRAPVRSIRLANEVLNKTAQLAAVSPNCRVVAINWGWDGGMVNR
jgi:hypothetical protein